MKYVLSLALLLSGLIMPVSALETKDFKNVDITKFISETQVSEAKLSGTDTGLHVAWWIPLEYWQVALSNQNLSKAQMERSLNSLRSYSIFGIIQGDTISHNANVFDFYTKSEVGNHLQIKYIEQNNVTELEILPEVPEDLKAMFQSFQPALASSMGEIGKNLHFFFVEDDSSQRVLSPYKSGKLLVELSTSQGNKVKPLTIETPLNSLHVPRKCPNGKEAHVSWDYCPWDGTKLAE